MSIKNSELAKVINALVPLEKGETKMKLEIYHEEKETVVEEPVRLALEADGNGGVTLIAVDKDGEIVDAGNLIKICKDGTFYREGSVNETLGFKLDKDGRIRETK